MKQKYNKIFWQVGQEITPETFIQADRYICSQQNLIRRLIAHQHYGLFPQTASETPSLYIKASLDSKDIYIEELVCEGITSSGYLIEFDKNIISSVKNKRLSIPGSNQKAYYIVLRVNPFEEVLIEPVENEETPLSQPVYELDIRELEQIREDELSILKIAMDGVSPKIDSDYIPPCMSVNSCSMLLENYKQIKQVLTEIQSHINLKKALYSDSVYPVSFLLFELIEFPLADPPVSLIRLIQKIIRTLNFFIPEIRNISEPDLLTGYNHNDITGIFRSCIIYLQEVQVVVSKEEKKVIVVEEEDFTPKI